MTIEITITCAQKHLANWLEVIAKFAESMEKNNESRVLYVKISEKDC